MHGVVIEQRAGRQCCNLRTVRFGRTAFCFNCRSFLGAFTPRPRHSQRRLNEADGQPDGDMFATRPGPSPVA